MSISSLPLSYCTNVHPGKAVQDVLSGLRQHTIPARNQLGERIAAGLWLAASVVHELFQRPSSLHELQQLLVDGDLLCYTLNTFPYGDFHGERVKENVYLPDWTDPRRLAYTRDCAQLLAKLLPPGTEGSLSTVPLGFKGFDHPADFIDRCIAQLLQLAVDLDSLHDDTGKVLRLAIEPEPCCVLETTAECIAFFQRLFAVAESRSLLDLARRHLGVCYDVCHQAVEFEDVTSSIQALNDAGIRINKVHLTCALEIIQPGQNPLAREQLARFAEPRYLHQTFARTAAGGLAHQLDLTQELCQSPPEPFCSADAWRVHFHVPVHREEFSALGTTREALKQALSAVSRLQYAPHLEVETYTWGVLPGEQPETLAAGLVRELSATQTLLRELSARC